MDLKDTITKWHSSMCLLEENKLNEAAHMLQSIISPSAKIHHNLGCICMLQNMFSDAIQYFSKSIEQDKFLSLSYFQRGICYLKTQRYDFARSDFEKAQSLTPETGINYNQLGADITLLPSDISEYLNHTSDPVRRAHLYIEASSTMLCVFQPPKKMVENLIKQNFLGKSKVVSSTEERDIAYASSKTFQETKVRAKVPHASSVPSSPAPSTSRVILSSNGTQIIVPPRPQRPAPILQASQGCQLQGQTNFQLLREKSRSAEDILDSRDRSHKATPSLGYRVNSAQKIAKPDQRLIPGFAPGITDRTTPTNQEEKDLAFSGRYNDCRNRVPCLPLKATQDQDIGKRQPPRRSEPAGAIRELSRVLASSSSKSVVDSISNQPLQSHKIGNAAAIKKPPKPPRPPPPQIAKRTD